MFLKALTLIISLTATQVFAASPAELSEIVMQEQLNEKPNFVYSNTSVDGLLSLVAYGYADPQQKMLEDYWGQDLDQRTEAIKKLSREVEGLIVSVNNQVWLDKKFQFLPSYLEAMDRQFSLTPQVMDVQLPEQVAANVNQWASDNTNELIKDVLKPDQVTSDVLSILANAVYFKGEWKDQFDKDLTQPAPFYQVGDVDTMTKPNAVVQAFINEDQSVLVVELPYKGDTHSMVMAMPLKVVEKVEGFSREETYGYDPQGQVSEVFQSYIAEGKAFSELQERGFPMSVDSFEMPKFEIESDINEIQAKLTTLGMGDLFKKGALSRMVDDPRAELSKVFQKAKIIVNEEGAEAAAVTIGIVVTESAVSSVRLVKINGPFAYAIRDNENGETLFEGVVQDPSAE